MTKESIIDDTKPNAGRIYDYLLGGHHNFEVDRQAAERLQQLIPFLPKSMRLQRWCLRDLAMELTKKRGFDVIVDFASGLPTNDHIHYVVPKGTTVIYSDYDPVVVEYAHDILKDTPNVYFFNADARRPEELLNRPEVREVLKKHQDVALIYWGISLFLSNEEISYAARSLYEWAGQGSCWAFNAQGAVETTDDPQLDVVKRIYAQMGTPIYPRTLDHYLSLIQPWHPDEKDFVSLLEWHGFDSTLLTEDVREHSGEGGGSYGAYLVK